MRIASTVRIGTKADEVLKMRGRSGDVQVAYPSYVGKDGQGFVVAWHYEDCDIILHRREGCYRVKEVLRNDNGNSD